MHSFTVVNVNSSIKIAAVKQSTDELLILYYVHLHEICGHNSDASWD